MQVVDEIIKTKNKVLVDNPGILSLLDERKYRRERKDWERCDEIRDYLSSIGIQITDTKSGQEWNLTPRRL